MFNETPISPRKCRVLLTKLVYLLGVGETFGTQEATTLFFGVTKLFQHKDVSLLRPRHSYRIPRARIRQFHRVLMEIGDIVSSGKRERSLGKRRIARRGLHAARLKDSIDDLSIAERSPSNGLSRHQRTFQGRRGRDYGHLLHHEGHATEPRGYLPTQRDSSSL